MEHSSSRGRPQSGVFARQFWPAPSTVARDGDNNILFGSSDPETINGQGGNDRISGFSGNDVLTGGTGSDYLFGGIANDILSADRHIGFDGRADVDYIYGEAGNDVIFAGYGDYVAKGLTLLMSALGRKLTLAECLQWVESEHSYTALIRGKTS